MTLEVHGGVETNQETNRRYEVNEMHMVNRYATRERPLCGGSASDDERIAVDYHLEERKDNVPVGTVCEGGKVRSIPFAEQIYRNLVDEGLPDDAEEHRRLARTLARETGQIPPG